MNFSEFNKNFFNNSDITWFDRKGVLKIDENKRAEITLSTNGYSSRYDSYFVKIIHKDNGKIAAKNFLFDEYMDIADSTRKYNLYVGGFSVQADGDGVGWYIATPSQRNIKLLVDAIMQYIDLYRN